MTRIFVLGMMAPRIIGAFGWRFFWATEQIQGKDISPEIRQRDPYKVWENDVFYPQPEVIVAVKDSKPASQGLWIVSDNVHEDVANRVLFLKGSRNFGEPAPRQNSPKLKMKVVKVQQTVINDGKKGKKQRKHQAVA